MPRPQRCRRICNRPQVTGFTPDIGTVEAVAAEDEAGAGDIILTFDEFEVIRLVDLEKQTHAQCAKQMEISRSTVTEIYESAREKIADSIVNGYHLTIRGGNYRLCDGSVSWCDKKHCRKQKAAGENEKKTMHIVSKGEHIMRIAVTYENGEIFQHFGHTGQFKFYDVADGKVVAAEIVDTNGSGHGALAGFLTENQADILICGGIGGGAQAALKEAGIKLFGGVSGSADEAVDKLVAGTLVSNPDVHCEHHDHAHGKKAHHCGDHGCGEHDCR